MEVLEVFKNAKWIRGARDPFRLTDCSVLFRKKFQIPAQPEKAQLSICALGLGIYTINGKPVTQDVLCTPYTRYDRRVLFQSYPVAHLLEPGDNVIGVHAGNGFYNNNMETWGDRTASWRDDPKVIAVLHIQYAGGETQTIQTDASWKWQNGPCVYNHMRQGEIYDARLRQNGWELAGFDDSSWLQAMLAAPPGGVLEPMEMEPVRITDTIRPVCKIGNVYDFGENLSGWVKIRGKGACGQTVRLTYDETLLREGEARDIALFTEKEHCKVQHQCIYIMDGSGTEEYAPGFCYFGFRYVRVEQEPEGLVIEAQKVHTDLQRIGSFCCNDDMLNQLHAACRRSTLANFFGLPTDCPHREQNGWTGDALLSADQSLMNFEMKKAYKKWMRDFKDVQRPSGQLPGIVPSAGWGYNWGSGPAWDSALIQIPWKVFLATGNTELIEEMWENMSAYMGFMDQMAQDGIVAYGLGDWCPPKEHSPCPTAVTDTSFYYVNHVLMAKMARLTGRAGAEWQEKGDAVRSRWRTAFLHRPDLEQYQTYWACALYQGLLNEEEKEPAAARLAGLLESNGARFACGTLGVKFTLSALSEHGYADLIYRAITNPCYPSYAWWIDQGMTTLCEEWDMRNSRNHHMFSEVDHWLYRYVGGIRFEEDGLRIQPVPIKAISSFRVTHRGITVEKEGPLLKIQIPVKAAVRWGGAQLQLGPGYHELRI